MGLEIEATYENGALKPERPLPLEEKEQVRIVIYAKPGHAKWSYGLIRWTRDPEDLERLAMAPEFGLEEGT